jgi:tripartite-type tricarboxylate transporter receptor subunit TctC
MSSRRSVRFVATILALLVTGMTLIACGTSAPAYPQKPVNLIVPIAAGGVVDIMARALAEDAKTLLPQPILIVNRAGAAGTVGTAEVIAGKPDGYNIGFVTRIMLTLQPQREQLPYKGPDDVRPVIGVASLPYVVAVRSESPWQTFKDMIAYAKANPGKLRFGLAGAGTVEDVDTRILQDKEGVTFAIVPVNGDGEATTAILGGNLDAKFLGGSVAPMVKAGKMRALAVVGDQRSPLFPDTPTFKELGYDFGMLPHFCVIAPKGTPDNVVDTLHTALRKAMDGDVFKKAAVENMVNLEYLSPQDVKTALDKDNVDFRDVITKYGMK